MSYINVTKANLEHLLLDALDKKQKKSVLQSLSKARNQGGIQRQQHRILLRQWYRRRLDDVNAILQQPIQRTECTLAIFFLTHINRQLSQMHLFLFLIVYWIGMLKP